jgi:hypothetical protein
MAVHFIQWPPAIESSDMILVCMSNPYKQSVYCRSEAEYAYTRQRHMIPLVMENKYRPDGWLGLICASKMYVDFTKLEFETAFQKLLVQIQLFRQQQSADQSNVTFSRPLETHEMRPPSVRQVGRNLDERSAQHGGKVMNSFLCYFDCFIEDRRTNRTNIC